MRVKGVVWGEGEGSWCGVREKGVVCDEVREKGVVCDEVKGVVWGEGEGSWCG